MANKYDKILGEYREADSGGTGGAVESVNSRTGAVILTKSDVSLSNVDNTSDVNKPVSTAQQTAINLKANLASPTFTGTVSGITATMVGAPSGSGTSSGTNTGDQVISDATITTTDITTNNFSTTKHGFVPKGTNVGNFLKDDGTWAAAGGGGGSVTISQAVIDFGTTSKTDEVFAITDAAVSPTSKVIASVAWNSSLSRDPDEIMADPITISVEPLSGSMNVYAMALEGSVQGKYAINYQVA